MPFLRIEKKGDATYLRMVQSYRDMEGKTRHKTLFNLGKTSDYSPETLKKIGLMFYELGGGNPEDLINGTIPVQPNEEDKEELF